MESQSIDVMLLERVARTCLDGLNPPIGITTAYGSANAVALTDGITWVPSSESNCLEGTGRGVRPLFPGHPSRQQTTNGRAFENSRGQDVVGSQSQAQRNRLRTLLPFQKQRSHPPG